MYKASLTYHSMDPSLANAFEMIRKAQYDQMNAEIERAYAEHRWKAQQLFQEAHASLAAQLQETMVSASTLASSENAGANAARASQTAVQQNNYGGANAARASQIAVKQNNGGLPDKVLCLQHLSRLVSERKLEEAFNKALSLNDVAIVSWLCTQVDLKALTFAATPLPLSQGVLLSLVQQLGCDLRQDTAHKLEWIREGALALNPMDPVVAPHMRPFLAQLYQNLRRQMQQLTTTSAELANSMHLVLHVVNSVLTACN